MDLERVANQILDVRKEWRIDWNELELLHNDVPVPNVKHVEIFMPLDLENYMGVTTPDPEIKEDIVTEYISWLEKIDSYSHICTVKRC